MNKKISLKIKLILLILTFVFSTQVLFASSGLMINLPSVDCVDTEVATNFPISFCEKGLSEFSYMLSFYATASNNVEISFGVDANNDGQLSDCETELVSGWDCSEWFILNNKTDFRYSHIQTLADGLRTFTCTLQTFSDGRIKNASFLDNGVEIFHSLKPEFPAWVYSSKWNMLRLVARGSDIRGDETFHIKVSHQGLVIYFK